MQVHNSLSLTARIAMLNGASVIIVFLSYVSIFWQLTGVELYVTAARRNSWELVYILLSRGGAAGY